MQWAYPERWAWLWLAPSVAAFWWWAFRRRRQALSRFADPALVSVLAGDVAWERRRLKVGLVTAGLLSLLVALVGPQWGFHWEEVRRRGVDIVIALDVSKSMLAEDVKPNRLQRAKLAIQELVPLLKGDRVGLLAFAGTSFMPCPLTVDYGAFSLTLEEVTTETIPRGGTAIAQAIRASLKAFEGSARGSRALVLITDGEDHEGDPVEAAKEAAKAGVKIFCIGIGTSEGELIPITDEEGHQTFLKDRQGRTVKSRLDEVVLQKVALESGGSYVRATATAFGLDVIYRERIAKLERQEFESALQKRYEHRFQWPLAVAFLLLGLEPLISDRRREPRAVATVGSDPKTGSYEAAWGQTPSARMG